MNDRSAAPAPAPSLAQADDFLAESEALGDLLETLAPADWDRPTQFKDWTPNDVVVHLHFWNKAADLSSTDEPAFLMLLQDIMGSIGQGLRPYENAKIAERGPELLALWRGYFREMAARWRDYDPKRRLKWAGPDMSARSSISARQMETWAHAHEVFDLMGVERREADRLQNVVRIGVNTFGWSHQVNGLEIPPEPPFIRLTAPSGAEWRYNDPGAASRIDGDALSFAQVVTQTRNIADTDLQVSGAVAEKWMSIAQCFAGPPETPPPPGARCKQRR
ncbi:MAG: TIGR03084 family metal-binding protein [Pseudomonadota bacterium]